MHSIVDFKNFIAVPEIKMLNGSPKLESLQLRERLKAAPGEQPAEIHP